MYRGVAYDLTAFIDNHPAGSWLINLSLGRDCTALFESYHLRPAVAVARLKSLPTIPDFPVAAVPEAPRPNDSDLYNTIRERVRTEVFKGEVRTHCPPTCALHAHSQELDALPPLSCIVARLVTGTSWIARTLAFGRA